jgi:hypothetical protein
VSAFISRTVGDSDVPISRVRVNEYHCVKCGYKWINRVNGVDGPVPTRCAKCKKANWDHGDANAEEVGMRRRVKSWEKFMGK